MSVGEPEGKRLGDVGVVGIIILKCMGWRRLAQYRDKWRAVVNTVVKLLVP